MSGTRLSRRRFLTVVATTAVAGVASGQTKTFEFAGSVSGWQGRSPEAIADETNPTLRLVAGQKYVVSWENVDGEPHNFAIENENGEVLKETEIISEKGGVQTVEFTAKPGMATYFSQVNPETMRGKIVVRQPTTTATQTTNGTAGTTNGTAGTNGTTGTTETATETTTTGTGPSATTDETPATETTTGDTANDGGQPGVGLLAALGSLAGLAYLLRRRGD
ncbi:cupredoxin domain-containing protein [Halomicrococcus sp. SG-WS-1]|uniref:cupredoxin domain-containing protein n=1 Tax=Halomicrococcus sp. SG-WS-1 TaxID=3439057 RepID=UPI003F7A0ACC